MKNIAHFDMNMYGRDFVVADIHGCFDLLKAKLHELKFSAEKDRLFSVGDLVDRGPSSADCIQWLELHWFNAVLGNHEDMLINYVENPNADKGNYAANGGQWAIQLSESQLKPYYTAFKALPIVITVDTPDGLIGIVHADIPGNDWTEFTDYLKDGACTVADIDSLKNYCVWSRKRIYSTDRSIIQNVHKVYVGHTIVRIPQSLGNVHYIDTGAFKTNSGLTVLQINGSTT